MSKSKVPSLESWLDVDATLGRLCMVNNDLRAAESQMNAELAAVKLRFDSALKAASDEDAALRAQVEQFAREHQEAFAPKKTVERLHGILSFRKTPPAVERLSRKWTWDSIKAALKSKFENRFIRTTAEIEKPTILTQFAAKEITAEQLADCGIRIGSKDAFELSLKYERAPEVPAAQS